MNYKETLDFLFTSLPMFQRIGGAAYKANLNNTQRMDEYFGHPHRTFHTIHVAGTNGKGSVSHMLSAVLQQAGYKVGLYTSPHLLDFRERIRVNGEMIPEQDVIDFVDMHQGIIDEVRPSFFEMSVMMAFDYFARSEVDVAVIEVGMGGRLDSTNIITPLISVITNISNDHKQFLGDTLAKIAGEKAGIIKAGIPVVIGETTPETAPVFIAKAKEVNSPILFADQMYRYMFSKPTDVGQRIYVQDISSDNEFDVEIDLAGYYQHKNVLTVLTALDVLAKGNVLRFDSDDVKNGLRHAAHKTGLMGRWQILGRNPLIVCDTGHNEAGIAEVVSQLKSCSYKKLYVVFGVVGDKDLNSVLPLLPKTAYYFFTQANIERAMDADILAERATNAGLKGEVVRSIPQALSAAKERATPEDMIYIGGSTFTVAEVI